MNRKSFDASPEMPSREEFLKQLLVDPVELGDLAYAGGLWHGVSKAAVENKVLELIEPSLRDGLIAPIHFRGTARDPFLTPDTSVEEVLDRVRRAIDGMGDRNFDEDDVDIWFEITPRGEDILDGQF